LLTGCNQTIPVETQIRSTLSTFSPLGVTTYKGEIPDQSTLVKAESESVPRWVLEEVHRKVVQRFRYRDDETESWDGGFEGDCDDFAITVQQVLAELGIRSDLVFAMAPMPDGSQIGHLFTMVGDYALDNRYTELQRISDLPYELVSYGNLGDHEWRKFITVTRYLSPQEHADEGPNLITAAPDLFKQLYETHCMLMFKDSGYLESDLYIKNAELLDKARGKP
jgi:predicted transglutaminase-like cysteine proteinase